MPKGSLIEFAKAHLRRLAKAGEVRPVSIRPGLRAASHVAIVVVHNEAPRMAAFLSHHRRLGFQHFIIVDNRSDDSLRADIASMDDVSLFSAEGAYKQARYGNDWVNAILSRYCAGKWILYVDADEHLVFAHADAKPIASLTGFLESTGRVSLPCVLVDMYSDRPIAENVCRSGQDPVEVCGLYDRTGYAEHRNLRTNVVWIKGGVRARLFFKDPWQGPALNKTPLVLWQRSYAFLKSAHELYPPGANERAEETFPLRGALLHFKFLSTLPALLARETQRQQHTTEYQVYTCLAGETGGSAIQFTGPATARYQSWRSLARDGLIVGADWPERSEAARTVGADGFPMSASSACGLPRGASQS